MKKIMLTALIQVAWMLGTTVAQAQPRIPIDEVPAVVVQGLQAYKGQRVSLFYVSGRETVVSAGGSLKVHTLKTTPQVAVISDQGVAQFAKTQIRRDSIFAFNYLLLAVHKPGQELVVLGDKKDGQIKSVPGDVRVDETLVRLRSGRSLGAADFDTGLTKYLSFLDLLEIYKKQGQKTQVVLSVGDWLP